jgi:hypothetical protein
VRQHSTAQCTQSPQHGARSGRGVCNEGSNHNDDDDDVDDVDDVVDDDVVDVG